MKKTILFAMLFQVMPVLNMHAQDTFSIVALDSVTGEVGSAGASCVDLINIFPNYPVDFLGDLIPGVGAINTQASYLQANQNNARVRMQAGDSPSQIISWLVANDVQSNPGIRQYGITAFVNGVAESAGYTGASCFNFKNHVAGPGYCIQGNILIGQQILDSMEARFLNASGDLACRLMAALQGANVVGADTRCAPDGTSSLFAFLKVSQPSDPYGSPSLLLTVRTPDNSGIEPIDSLQTLFDTVRSCSAAGIYVPAENRYFGVYPNPATTELTLDLPDSRNQNSSYRIIEQTGRIVESGILNGNQTVISMASYQPGVYFIEVDDTSGSLRRRVVVR